MKTPRSGSAEADKSANETIIMATIIQPPSMNPPRARGRLLASTWRSKRASMAAASINRDAAVRNTPHPVLPVAIRYIPRGNPIQTSIAVIASKDPRENLKRFSLIMTRPPLGARRGRCVLELTEEVSLSNVKLASQRKAPYEITTRIAECNCKRTHNPSDAAGASSLRAQREPG